MLTRKSGVSRANSIFRKGLNSILDQLKLMHLMEVNDSDSYLHFFFFSKEVFATQTAFADFGSFLFFCCNNKKRK